MFRAIIYGLAISMSFSPGLSQLRIVPGQEVNGQLSPDDRRNDDGIPFDEYMFTAQAGEVIHIDVESRGFRPRPFLLMPAKSPPLVSGHLYEKRRFKLSLTFSKEGRFGFRIMGRRRRDLGRYVLRLSAGKRTAVATPRGSRPVSSASATRSATSVAAASPFRQRYELIYEGAEAWARDVLKETKGEKHARHGVTVGHCTVPLEIDLGTNVPPAPLEGEMRSLARKVAWLRAEFQDAGYPASLYKSELEAYEQGTLNTYERALLGTSPSPKPGDWPSLRVMSERIETERARLRPDLPGVNFIMGCLPPGDLSAVVRAEPANGRVWLITRFAYFLCSARLPDPWDKAKCTDWWEMDPKHPLQLFGRYMYQAQWPNGSQARGDRTIRGGIRQDGTVPVYAVRPN